MNSLVVLDRGVLRVHRMPEGTTTAIAGADAANRQPTWSPDGRYLAWSRYDRRSPDAQTKLVVVDTHSDERREFDIVFPAFYVQWRPDGGAIATLGEGPLGLELTVVDLRTGTTTILVRGGPVFFDWQASGALLVNTGTGTDRRFEYYGPGSGAGFVAHRPASFSAPARVPGTDCFVVAIRSGDDSHLVVADGHGAVTRTLTTFSGSVRFVVSNDGRHIAWTCGRNEDGSAPRGAAVPDELCVQDLATEHMTVVVHQQPLNFEWSNDSTKLLYLSVDDIGGARWMRWNVWDRGPAAGHGASGHGWVRPSAIEAREYLPFAEQYTRTIRRWAPDDSAFCYAGTSTSGKEGVWIKRLDRDDAEMLTTGGAAWWTPRAAEP